MSGVIWHIPAALVPAVFAACVYMNALEGSLVYDDGATVRNNPDVWGNTTLAEVWLHDYWGRDITDDRSHKSYRPLAVLTLRANFALHGLSPFGYHLVNVGLHVVVCLLVYVVANEIHSSSRSPLQSKLAGCLTATLFACHPIHTEAVANVSGRAELLCAFFYIAAYILHGAACSARCVSRHAYMLLCSFAVLGALYSKENGLTLMPLLALSCWRRLVLECGSGATGWFIRALPMLVLPSAISAGYLSHRTALVSGANFMPRVHKVDNAIPTQPDPIVRPRSSLRCVRACGIYTTHNITRGMQRTTRRAARTAVPAAQVRAASYAYVHAVYASKLCWPTQLSADYSFASLPILEHGLADARLCAPLALYLCLLGLLGFALLQAARHPCCRGAGALLAQWCWLVVPFATASNVLFPVATTVAERLLYLPSVGFCMLLASVLARAMGEPPRCTTLRRVCAVLARLAAVAVLLAYCYLTVARNHDWRSNIILFRQTVRTAPNSMKAHRSLASELMRADGSHRNVTEAVEQYRRAAEIMPDLNDIHYELGSALQEAERVAEAIGAYSAACALKPDDYRSHNQLAFMLVRAQQLERARDAFARCFTLRPHKGDMLSNLGNIAAMRADFAEAERWYRTAIRLEPRDTSTRYNLAALHARQWRFHTAVQVRLCYIPSVHNPS
jgi:Flp pilus assembly protein TadD